MKNIDLKGVIKYVLFMAAFGIIYLVEESDRGEYESLSLLGSICGAIFWIMLLKFITGLIALPFYLKNQNQINSFANELADFIQKNHLHGVDKNDLVQTSNGNEPVGFCPLYDDFGNQYLIMFNAHYGQRILIKKGDVTGYHLNVDGRQYRTVGGSFFGMGFVKGGVQKVSRIEMVISLNNISNPVVHYRIATDLPASFFDEYQHFADRLSALLTLYM